MSQPHSVLTVDEHAALNGEMDHVAKELSAGDDARPPAMVRIAEDGRAEASADPVSDLTDQLQQEADGYERRAEQLRERIAAVRTHQANQARRADELERTLDIAAHELQRASENLLLVAERVDATRNKVLEVRRA